jgi:hypothetical protein
MGRALFSPSTAAHLKVIYGHTFGSVLTSPHSMIDEEHQTVRLFNWPRAVVNCSRDAEIQKGKRNQ